MAGFMDPILAQIARQGDIMMYGQQLQRQRQQDEMTQRQQGLQERQTLAQLAALEQQQEIGNKRRQTLADLVRPRQVGGPLAGAEQYQPLGMQTPQFDSNAAYQALIGIGDIEGAMQFQPKASEGFTLGEGQARFDASGRPIARLAPSSGLTGDAKNLEAILGRKPTQAELIDFKKAGATSVNVGVNTGKRQSAVVDSMLGKIDEKYTAALSDKTSLDRIKTANEILDRSGNSVTGLSGAIKAAVAPYATAVGLNTAQMNDAQILQTLLDTNAGSLRMEIVGPGPVSNFEQGVLQKVSGRKISAAEGVKQILSYHRKSKETKLKAFNNQLKNASSIEGYQNIVDLYPPIEFDAGDEGAQQAPTKPGQPSGIKFLGFE